jgi:hypothetical protein
MSSWLASLASLDRLPPGVHGARRVYYRSGIGTSLTA